MSDGKFYKAVIVTAWAAVLIMTCSAAGVQELPEKPPGQYFPLKAERHEGTSSFEAGQPVVGTTYFYWYDIPSKAHIINGDGTDALTTHPADMNDISYLSVSWHRQQMADMIAAGIDFLMPVFWGVPGDYDGWSFAGLGPMVEAHGQLEKEGKRPPAIGLFYDTSILSWNSYGEGGRRYHVDLATEFGKEWFYTAARDFFSLVPPAKWARVDGCPIVFLYGASFAKRQGEGQLEHFERRFEEDFGVEPFVVKNSDWQGEADATYSWGGAVNGPLLFRHTVSLGPGYDHSAVPGRSPLVVDRGDGKTYVDRWLKVFALHPRHRPWMVHVETWNEWHEGTDIAHSAEYGRSYIVLTELFSDMWRAKVHLPAAGSYGGAERVSWRAGASKGVAIRPSGGDGVWRRKDVGGVAAAVSAANPHSDASRYLYFNVDDAFAFDLFDRAVRVIVTYYDAGCDHFEIEYDNVDATKGAREGAFRAGGRAEVGQTEQWKTASLPLGRCRFMNRCNGADFRIAVLGGDMSLAVREVVVEKK